MASIVYLDFDLRIQRVGEGYHAQVLNSPAGQATASFSLPFSELEVENLLLRFGRPGRATRRIDSPEVEAAKLFGERLFTTVFEDDVRACLRSSLDEARRQGGGLRIRLHLADAPELAELPWEYLYNPTLNRFFALSVETPIVRYLELPEVIRPLLITPPLRVLVMISSPSDYPRLDVEGEWGKLQDSLDDLVQRGVVMLERLDDATLSALQQRLRRGEYHIFHFIGHGGFEQQDGVLIMEDDRERGHSVSGQHLGMLLHDHRAMRLAVLNACEGARASRTDPFSGTAQSLVQQGVPAVIAMQFEVTDQAAITFAHEIYGALADGYPVDAALSEARKAIFAQGNSLEWGTPVLYLRAPDGLIFNVERRSTPLPEAGSERPSLNLQSVEELRKGAKSGDEPVAKTRVLSLPAKADASWGDRAKKWMIGAVAVLVVALTIGAMKWLRKEDANLQPLPAAHLIALTVNADRRELKVKEALSLKLKGRYSDGTEEEITQGIEWQSTDPPVATVDSQGRVEAHKAGQADITAQYRDVASPPWTLAVQAREPPKAVPPPVKLVSLTVSADKRDLRVKERAALRVKGTYSDEKEGELSTGVEWRSSDGSIAAVNSRGEVEALREGKTDITAKSGEVVSSPLSLIIRGAVKKPEPEPPAKDSKIQYYISAAKAFRDQGNYAGAISELEKARAIDPASKAVRDEAEITQKACNAEKRLGRSGLEC